MTKVNYHTHTTRCHHANGSDEAYVQAAIQAGFKELGFADHTPWLEASPNIQHIRMAPGEIDDYVTSIQNLAQKYQDAISLKIGLECEYHPTMMPWLKKVVKMKGLDYLILGNHFHDGGYNHVYYGAPTMSLKTLWQYVEDIKGAIDSGMFSYIAHPDLIHYQSSKDQNYQQAMSELCQYAKNAEVPLEFNLLGYKENRHYPCPDFWEIAAACGNQVIIGFDAHEPSHLTDEKIYQKALAYLNDLGIEIIDQIRFLK